jgi:hypothetical protein
VALDEVVARTNGVAKSRILLDACRDERTHGKRRWQTTPRSGKGSRRMLEIFSFDGRHADACPNEPAWDRLKSQMPRREIP